MMPSPIGWASNWWRFQKETVLRMQVREEMTNGFDILHGGVSYSLADSALAFAANTHGQHALSVETSISHLRAVQPGEWQPRDLQSAKQVGEQAVRHRDPE